MIVEWHDRRIVPGDEWKDMIDQQLEESHLILLLISAYFLDSDSCDKEMRRALAKQGEVVSVILRPVDWEHEPLRKLQALPKDGRPVTAWGDPHEACSAPL